MLYNNIDYDTVTVNDLFKDVSVYDFEPTYKSVSINAGQDVGNTTDYLGHRYRDTIDIGAIEFKRYNRIQ